MLEAPLDVYLVDGTYELFRHYYAVPSARDKQGREVGAVRGVLASVLGMIKGGATHIAVATDHVIESFRNQLWPGYKTSAGVEPEAAVRCRGGRTADRIDLRRQGRRARLRPDHELRAAVPPHPAGVASAG